jgi:putative phosphoribosyl transferase
MASEMSTPIARSDDVAPPAFRNRAEAGVRLGAALREVLGELSLGHSERVRVSAGPATTHRWAGRPLRVFAVPRGGIAVGVGVARALRVPLDVVVVRKLGHPEAPELGLGAIAEAPGAVQGGPGAAQPFFDEDMLAQVGLTPRDLTAVVARERVELARRVALYRVRPAAADLAGHVAVVVDDGLATGVTARAALRAMRARGAAGTLLAVPVAAPAAVEAMKTETGEVVTLVTPRRFVSVGEWYTDFGQLTDADVLTLLAAIP